MSQIPKIFRNLALWAVVLSALGTALAVPTVDASTGDEESEVEDFPTTHQPGELPGLATEGDEKDDERDEDDDEEADSSGDESPRKPVDDAEGEPDGEGEAGDSTPPDKSEETEDTSEDDQEAVDTAPDGEPKGAEGGDESDPPTIDESRAERQEGQISGDDEEASDDDGGSVDEPPEPHHMPTYWRQMGAGALMSYSSLALGTLLFVAGENANDPELAGTGGLLMFFGPTLGTSAVVNTVGNRTYSDQYLGAFTGNLLGLFPALVVGVIAGLVVEDALSNPGSSSDAPEIIGGLAVAGVSGGFLTWATVEGYHRQLVISNWLDERRASVGISPVVITETSTEDVGLGLGLSGRF